MQPGTLHFISGRLAAGKTTLARKLAPEHHAVLFCEDVWLAKLSEGIWSFDDYLKWPRRCRLSHGPVVVDILKAGASVVLDFAGNRITERAWARNLSEEAGSTHLLHYLALGEEECLHRLRIRKSAQTRRPLLRQYDRSGFPGHLQILQVPDTEEGLTITTYRRLRFGMRY